MAETRRKRSTSPGGLVMHNCAENNKRRLSRRWATLPLSLVSHVADTSVIRQNATKAVRVILSSSTIVCEIGYRAT